MRGTLNSFNTHVGSFRHVACLQSRRHGGGRNASQRVGRGGRKIGPSSSAWLSRQSKDPYAKRARDEGVPSRALYKLEQIDFLAAKSLSKLSEVEGGTGRSKGGKKGGKRPQGGGSRSRSLFSIGQKVIDLGASPGGWSLYAAEKIGTSGTLVSVDLLKLDRGSLSKLERSIAFPQFCFVQGDFHSAETKAQIIEVMRESVRNTATTSPDIAAAEEILESCADCIISDMAANFTGDKRTDALRTMSLCEDALMFSAGSSCFDDEGAAASSVLSVEDASLLPRRDIGMLKIGGAFLCKMFACGQENERDLMTAAKRHFQRVDMLKPPASRKESGEKYLLAVGYRGNAYLRALAGEQRT